MTLRICHEWDEIKYIEVTCPYCREIDTYHGSYGIEGEVVRCHKCGKKFKLGEQE